MSIQRDGTLILQVTNSVHTLIYCLCVSFIIYNKVTVRHRVQVMLSMLDELVE